MITRTQISGLILTGGQGRRLQAKQGPAIEKGLLSLQGTPLVARMQAFMAPGVSHVFISANRHLDTYANYGQVIPDAPDLGDSQGPLAGIASVLAHVNTPWLFVMPVDIPYPPAGLLDRLVLHACAGNSSIYYVHAKREHPLCMLMRPELGAALRAYLASGQRRVQEWQRQHAAIPVIYQADSNSFLNINTPEDLYIAQQQHQTASD